MLSLLQIVLYKWIFLFWVFRAFNFGSAYTLVVGIALKRHTTKNKVKQLPIYSAQFQMQWRRGHLPSCSIFEHGNGSKIDNIILNENIFSRVSLSDGTKSQEWGVHIFSVVAA